MRRDGVAPVFFRRMRHAATTTDRCGAALKGRSGASRDPPKRRTKAQ
ncbi:hypothetical protein LA76x_4238 [Lysobacter antibioticus]|uniref:Uncharacterized protein n=1 Tax=Lysobacter antibioticus TaxID=84531 RepID=A0A0S2FFQ0_LYSAN|nr:hypothetical protein LA76x_4238 [Lysobacter antibioticus]